MLINDSNRHLQCKIYKKQIYKKLIYKKLKRTIVEILSLIKYLKRRLS